MEPTEVIVTNILPTGTSFGVLARIHDDGPLFNDVAVA